MILYVVFLFGVAKNDGPLGIVKDGLTSVVHMRYSNLAKSQLAVEVTKNCFLRGTNDV